MQVQENKTLSLVLPENWHFVRGIEGVSSANYLTTATHKSFRISIWRKNQQQTHYTDTIDSAFSDIVCDNSNTNTNTKQYRTKEDNNSLHTEPDEDEGYETDETDDFQK